MTDDNEDIELADECPVRNPHVLRESLRELENRKLEIEKKISVQKTRLTTLKEGVLKRLVSTNGRRTAEIKKQENFISGVIANIERLKHPDIPEVTRNIKIAKAKLIKYTDLNMEQFFQQVVFEAVDEQTYSKWRAESVRRFRESYRLKDENEPSA